MKKLVFLLLLPGLFASCLFAEKTTFQELSLEEYRSKMEAGWIGQMAGVGWGAPTEFRYKGTMIPAEDVPEWTPGMINQFTQDDLYVEMTFIRTLEEYGWDVSIRQAGIDFANSGYWLWHANSAGRFLLREGIAPPDSGHPKFNSHADDIDYQIEADFSGLICPGLPNQVIRLGDKFGRIMNYGDGLYGGQFVGAMYAAAFFETDMEKVVLEGLKVIPEGSQYHECVTDVLNWYHQYPDDWEKTWKRVDEKYQRNPKYRQFSCAGPTEFNIDATINGAYIVMGLLYGGGDPDRTIVVSMRCGADSDCNPSNAAGILFTSRGMDWVPERFKSVIERDTIFSHTAYDWNGLMSISEDLARQAVISAGGKIRKKSGKEVFILPIEEVKPGPLEQCHEPGPIANSRFTKKEMKQIKYPSIQGAVDLLAPGWKVSNWSTEWFSGVYPEMWGEENVLVTQRKKDEPGCVIEGDVPIKGSSFLNLRVGTFPWKVNSVILVHVDGQIVREIQLNPEKDTEVWKNERIDLSRHKGKTVHIALEGRGPVFYKKISISN